MPSTGFGLRQWTVAAVVWLSVASAVIGFFLPWASIDLREPSLVTQGKKAAPLGSLWGGRKNNIGRVTVSIRRGTETVTGDLLTLADIPHQVSGVQIPQLANQEQAKVAMALIELFTQTREHVGLKRYAVYLLPGLALVCGLLLTLFRAPRLLCVGLAALCAAVAGIGCWKLLTTNTQTLFVAITIGPGLWLSLWAYVGLAIAAGLQGVSRGLKA